MNTYVLDSYALIAYFEDEAGAGKVEKILREAENRGVKLLLNVINWGEVYYSIYRSKGEERAEESILIIEQLPIDVVDMNKDFIYQAARLKAHHAVALGDCMAAALALKFDCSVVTGDKEFKKFKEKIRIEWID